MGRMAEVVMPPRERLGWVVRAIPPSEGFCHGIELDDHKIVTLSRYLYQHARPNVGGHPEPWKWIHPAKNPEWTEHSRRH